MVLNVEKRSMLVEAASKLKIGVGPSDAPSAPIPAPAPANLRQKGVVEAIASEDETPVLISSLRGKEALMLRS